jgi:hypothetical protein
MIKKKNNNEIKIYLFLGSCLYRIGAKKDKLVIKINKSKI